MGGGESTQLLTAFLAEVSACPDPESARRIAGFTEGESPDLDIAGGAVADVLELPGIGACRVVSAPVEDGATPALLMLARAGDAPFGREDVNLLRGMARLLTLSLRMMHVLERERALRAESQARADENAGLLASLEERRRLLEQLGRIQQTMSHRTRLQDVLDVIAESARELFSAGHSALRLMDATDSSQLVTMAASGLDAGTSLMSRRTRIDRGATGRAIETGAIVVMNDYQADLGALPELRATGVQAVMAVPLTEHGTVVGALVVGTSEAGRRYGESDQMLLTSFAEQASLALAAARTADTMRQAFNDSLTGLANRALFLDRLEHSLVRAERAGSEATVLFIDLDRFKPINDSLGHAAGDKLLVAVAERLRRCLRRAETVARLGGDEFAVLLEETRDVSEAARVADRIIASLRSPFRIQDTELFISASVGIATGSGDAEDLLRNADVAMYRAKSRAPGRYEVFEPGMHAEAVERLELEADLQRAIERGELRLHYQPIVRLDSAEIVGVEALVRWLHPRRGLLPPSAFIPLAEETGLILPLGRWVLGEAARQVAEWQRESPAAPLQVSVNLSGWQLAQPSLVDDVREELAASGLAHGTLILELTETILMTDTEASIEKLHALKRLGVQLAIDDFGTGYSSLRYLQRFPIDVLKIAKPFVDGLTSCSEDSLLARAIVDLSRNLQLGTIAEGIEEPEQLAILRGLGCAMGQGFHFARPLEPAVIEELLFASREVGAQAALRVHSAL